MKTTMGILDDDYIGGQGSLTIDEEKALSDYFKQKKLLSKKPSIIPHQRNIKHSKATS